MSHRYLPFAVALLACTAVVRADDPKSTAVPPYELKNRSAFAKPGEIQRAPFWPIGWVKRAAYVAGPAAILEAPKVTLDARNFKVTSILLGAGTNPSLAVINGRAYSEGEFLRMPKTPGVAPVRIRVQRIADGSVVLQNATQTLVTQLQRPEINSRRPDEQLLDLENR
jgi:hypothetical protein